MYNQIIAAREKKSGCGKVKAAMSKVQNPLLKGFYPDPSICRVDCDYYLVNSTFTYVPGIPIFHSKDLVSWKQLGHVLERKEQLGCLRGGASGGIYAPCIRYHKGMYYVSATNVSDKGNFYVTAEKPEGPWSNPNYLENAPGIDPSLYFEGDKCWYIGQRTKENGKYDGDCEIWIRELDLAKRQLTGKTYVVWDGALKKSIWTEGPRLYKRGDYYYILTAEGGTEYNHSICVARSRELLGGYEPCPHNPVFTHRHLGRSAKIQNTGHGDLFDTPDGKWYIVMLGTRPTEGYAPLGRETLIAEAEWEEDWPIINPGEGKIRDMQEVYAGLQEEAAKTVQPEANDIRWEEPLDKRCVFFGFSEREMYQIEKDGRIALRIPPVNMKDKETPAYIGIRVTDKKFSAKTVMECMPKGKQEAGLVYLYDHDNYVRFIVTGDCGEGSAVKVIKTEKGREEILYSGKTSKKEHILEMALDGLQLCCILDEACAAAGIDIRNLTSEGAGGFTGCTMGIYAGSNHETDGKAAYARFSKIRISQDGGGCGGR